MNIQSSSPSPLTRKAFTYNPQDPTVSPDQTVELDVRSNDGHPETDTVVFANKKAIFDIWGNLQDIVDDPARLGRFCFQRPHR
jgi:hypothetical protein